MGEPHPRICKKVQTASIEHHVRRYIHYSFLFKEDKPSSNVSYMKKNSKVPVSKNINRIVSIMQICSRIDFLWNFHCYVFLLLSCYQQIWTNF